MFLLHCSLRCIIFVFLICIELPRNLESFFLRETTFITIYYYDYSVLKLVIATVPNFKLNFIIDMYVYLKNIAYMELGTICNY
jgi:hypothetical protein